MDVRIGVTQAAREITLELDDEAPTRESLRKAVDAALSGATDTLWVTDKRGRQVGVPSSKIAYVDIGSSETDRRMGFGG